MNYIIRMAIDLDLMRLIEIGKEYFDETGDRWSSYTFNENKLMRAAMSALKLKEHIIFVAVDTDTKEIAGFFWGCITGQMFCNEPIAHDIFLYVRPSHRDLDIGKDLIKEFMKWCEVMGCKTIQVGANSGIGKDAPAATMYKSLGFKSGGYCFNYKL